MWKCGVCNFIYEGEGAPDKCPKCGAPKEKFTAMAQEKADLVRKSRFTNELHMELSGCLENVIGIAESGMEDNLDPACMQLFTRAKEQALLLQQMIKAEIETHISKGKWG